MPKKPSDQFPLVMILGGLALLYLGKNIFDNLVYAFLMRWLTQRFGVQEAQVIGGFSSIATPLLLAVLIVVGLYKYVHWELSQQPQHEPRMTMRELQAQHESNIALREHTEELRLQREAQEVQWMVAPPRPLTLEVGREGPFVTTKAFGLRTIKRTYNLRVENRNPTKPITNCRVSVLDVTPDPMNKKLPWSLSEPFSLSSGADIYIPIATYGESRNPKEYPASDTLIQVHSSAPDDWFLMEMTGHVMKIRATSHDSGYCDLTCKLWVDGDGRFQIEEISSD
jgi:hypothetical protein